MFLHPIYVFVGPKQHKMEDLFPGRVVNRNSASKDKNINTFIQEQGAHQGRGVMSEAEWHRRNKNYSKK